MTSTLIILILVSSIPIFLGQNQEGGCLDNASLSDCIYLSRRGDCESNVQWMRHQCEKTCGYCFIDFEQNSVVPANGRRRLSQPNYSAAMAQPSSAHMTQQSYPAPQHNSPSIDVSQLKPDKNGYVRIPLNNNSPAPANYGAPAPAPAPPAKPTTSYGQHPGPATSYSGASQTGLKSPPCKDELPQCSVWKSMNQCGLNALFMAIACQKSCGFCLTQQIDPNIPTIIIRTASGTSTGGSNPPGTFANPPGRR